MTAERLDALQPRGRRGSGIAAAIVLSSLLVVACGSSSNDSTTTQPSGNTSPSAEVDSSPTTAERDGSGKEEPENLADIAETLDDAGIECQSPEPYVAAEDELELGATPLETIGCAFDGASFEVARWASADERGEAWNAGLSMACSFGAVELGYAADGPWVLAPDGWTSKEQAAVAKAAEALGAEVQVKTC